MNSGKDSGDGDSARNETILAYLAGELGPEAAREFERKLREDAALRAEFERWKDALTAARQWMDDNPPGLDRVREIPIPQIANAINSTNRRGADGWLSWLLPIGARRLAIQGLAALLVFAAGYLFGTRKTEPQSSSPAQEARNSEPSRIVPVTATSGPKERRESPAPTEVASALQPVPRYVSEENGKMIVETTLAASGSRATWIVDGKFQIPSSERQ